MKKVIRNRFKDYNFNILGSRKFLANNVEYLQPKPLWMTSLIFLGGICLFSYNARPFFLAFLVVYFYYDFSAKKLSKDFKVTREFPERTKEEKAEEITYHITNPYSQEFNNLIISDTVRATQSYAGKSDFSYFVDKLPANRITDVSNVHAINNGMGKKQSGPLVVLFSDFLGLNLITFLNDNKFITKVFPKIYPTKTPKEKPDLQSMFFGLFDTYNRGENVNFFSTREYQQGDNVKKINWKLSLRGNNLIVNEFENNTNAMTYAVLIDDNRIHYGSGRESTLEYCKDLILSLIHSCHKNHSSLGFLSHQKHIEAKEGKKHLNHLELFLGDFDVCTFDKTEIYHKRAKIKETDILFRKIRHHIPRRANIFIFVPYMPGKLYDAYMILFQNLIKNGYQIRVINIHGFKEIIKRASEFDQKWLTTFQSQSIENLPQVKEFLRSNNIPHNFIEIGIPSLYKDKIKNAYTFK